jgi:glutamine synthetase
VTYPLLRYCIYRFQLRMGLTQGVLAANHNLLTVELKFACRYSKADAGSGAHVHLSIWQGNRNVFMGSGPGSKHGMSKAGQEFMAGVLLHLPSILAFTAPNPNRFVSWGANFGQCSSSSYL